MLFDKEYAIISFNPHSNVPKLWIVKINRRKWIIQMIKYFLTLMSVEVILINEWWHLWLASKWPGVLKRKVVTIDVLLIFICRSGYGIYETVSGNLLTWFKCNPRMDQ